MGPSSPVWFGLVFISYYPEVKTIRCNFQTKFITTHKNVCRCASFSPDGKYVATGSADTSIKVLDVQRMLQFSGHGKDLNADESAAAGASGIRPVTKTFYDHTQSINDLAFHPFLPILASASRDNSIKLFDYGGSQKKAHQVLQDTHNVRSIVFHPSGECTLFHPIQIRLY